MLKSKLKILFIDEEGDNNEFKKFEKAISKNLDNYVLFLANNKKNVLSQIYHKHPSVILLNLDISTLNGIELLAQIKTSENIKHIPVIVLSANDNDKKLLECYRLSIAGYLKKSLKDTIYEQKIITIMKYINVIEFIAN